MVYDGLAIAVAVVSLFVVWLASRLLFRRGWLLGWFKGMLGFTLVAAAIVIALVAWDVFSYQQLLEEKSVATVSFERLDSQLYRAVLVDGEGVEQRFNLRGDQWQLDARLMKWKGFVSAWGIAPGYRLDRLSGRYYSLEKERSSERTVYELNRSQGDTDVWAWLNQWSLPFVDAHYGSATFVPMSDGALFEVSLTNSGLVARALNERAQSAIERWK